MQQALGVRIAEVRLFGSRARGDADEESDVDLFVALTDDDPRRDVKRAAARLANELSLENGLVLSVLLADRAFLENHRGYALLESIQEEGIAL